MPGFKELASDLFVWTDTCNVYVLRDGPHALLIDLGDGSVLDALGEIGVRDVEWILFTHHHREQCQGGPRLAGMACKTACHQIEKPFFETPNQFRKWRPTLGDAFTVYGPSYLRPPVEPIRIDRTFSKMDSFAWRGREFWCVETAGNSPGHMAFLVRAGDRWWAFAGDLMVEGARMHTWFDTEWDYGFAKGLFELGKSAAQIAGYGSVWLLPSHGVPVPDARPVLEDYVRKLRRLATLCVRGYDIQRFDNCDQDNTSRPSEVPHLWRVTPHLYKFRGPNYWTNFALILSRNGHALLVDCGLFDLAFLDATLALAKERLGLKKIDAVFVTHLHGDHALDAEHIRRQYGAQLWTMEGVADKFERPWDHDLCALLPSYVDRNKPVGPLKFDRVIAPGGLIEWEEFMFAVDWMPGQSKYHACLHGEIDGRRVAFTGDNVFANPRDPEQGGNEAVVARNACVLEESYLQAAAFLHGIGPDILVGGHCWLMAEPKALIERLRVRMEALREAFRGLSVSDDYRYWFDPYWVKAWPYRVAVQPGQSTGAVIQVRNFRDRPQRHAIRFRCPAGVSVEPPQLSGTVAGGTTDSFPVQVRAAGGTAAGLRMIAFDLVIDDERRGELFDFIVWVGEPPADAPPAKTSGGY
jgi:glyoxylase-like metal-dependent hydrolase (beta-lactamase superfamily II)